MDVTSSNFLGQSVSGQSARLFACPFYKHEEITKSGSPQDCSYTGGGFKNMAGLTRHLKQQHVPELERCQTCSRFFLTCRDFDAHQNNPIGCQRRAPPKGHGQQILWFDVYALLFPEARQPPNPYYPQAIASTKSHYTTTSQPEECEPECLPKSSGSIAASSPPKGSQVVGDLLNTIETFLSQLSPSSQTRIRRALQQSLTEQLSQEKDRPLFPHGHGNVAGQSQESLPWEDVGLEAGATSMPFQYEPGPQIGVHPQNPGSEDSTTNHVSHYAGASQGSSNALWNGPPPDQICSPPQWNPQDLPAHFQGGPDRHFTDGGSRSGWGNDSGLELFSSTAPHSTYRVNYQEWPPHGRFQS